MSPILVTSYRGPDLDGTACAFAYAELLNKQGRNALATVLGTPHLEARHVAERFDISLPPDLDPSSFGEIVLVDTSALAEQDQHLPTDHVIEIIDHRKLHEGEKFPRARLQIELVGSAATLIVERFQQAHIVPSREATLLLFGAVASNTVNFKANVTTGRDRQAGDWLRSLYPIPDDFIPMMFAAKSKLDGNALEETLMGDFSYREIAGKKIAIGQLEVVGAGQLFEMRYQDLVKTLDRLQEAHPEVDQLFISAIDVVEGYNLFLVPNQDVREALTALLDVTFDERHIAYRPGILMRKEIGPMWKEWVEKFGT